MMEQIGALVYNGISLRSIPLYTNAKTTNYSRKMCQVILTRSLHICLRFVPVREGIFLRVPLEKKILVSYLRLRKHSIFVLVSFQLMYAAYHHTLTSSMQNTGHLIQTKILHGVVSLLEERIFAPNPNISQFFLCYVNLYVKKVM